MSKKRLERIHELTEIVLNGLNGKPFSWGDGQRTAWVPLLQEIGITLITKTQIQKRGLVLKRGAKPVGKAYFGSPIKRYADLYVMEVQCTEPKKPDTDCWLFLDCEVMTGKPPGKCPNYKQCKQNALHSSNRTCILPFSYTNKTCLVVNQNISEEAKSGGWHPAVGLFYEYEDKTLLVGKKYWTVPESAQALGFAKAEATPYWLNSKPGYLYVTRYTPASEYPSKFKEAGWYPSIDLPYSIHPDWDDWKNEQKISILEVDFNVDAPEYIEAIAQGWYPAQKITAQT
ncbi:hypothetical protein H6G76_29315 [Nostoc sp. FACHB-152]|uniref:hypothetical protein n=1 Tax=unclassified Nostoc TaxID=2593658 RepID=UPI0016849C38|nr:MULTISPECIES: hypothetical protein [unclassified Nostoc]MBD2451158.1 hypothetical protein [Nostoc sp. FACHB-152]MBD2473324.1 hypothetical protein [Nostoc sp. FACHB-145]